MLNLKETLIGSLKNEIGETVDSFKYALLDSINKGIDTIGLISVMATWLLHMMSVPNAGRWCYTIFALYIVGKVVLKALCLI